MLEIYKWSVLITAVFFTSFGGYAFYRNPKDKQSRLFALVSVAFAIWSYSWFGLLNNSHSYDEAVFFARLLNLGATLIPVFYLHWVLVTVDFKISFNKLLLVFSYVITAFFLFFSFSDTYVTGVQSIGIFPYWPVAGSLYTIFIIINYFGLVTYSFITLLLGYKDAVGEKKSKISYLLLGSILGFGGGATNFPLMYGYENIQPIGIFLVMASPFIFSYATIRYKLFDVKIVTTQFFVGALNIVFIINLLVSTEVSQIFLNSMFLGFVFVFSILLVKSVNREIEQREKIEILAKELKEANQGQASLMHFMNHQIKGRLGNTKNIFAELLAGDYGTISNEAIPLIKKGLEEADTGVNYVQGILKGASAENGTLPYSMKEVDMKNIVEEVVEKQKEYAEKKGLTLDFTAENGDYGINGDFIELGEAIKNLIDNSINYTLEGNIEVSLYIKDDKIIFRITDTGVGMTKKDREKLFKAGGRGEDSLKININATGYGLVFVKGVIEAHKGRVWAESEGRGEGSTFYVELPKIN